MYIARAIRAGMEQYHKLGNNVVLRHARFMSITFQACTLRFCLNCVRWAASSPTVHSHGRAEQLQLTGVAWDNTWNVYVGIAESPYLGSWYNSTVIQQRTIGFCLKNIHIGCFEISHAYKNQLRRCLHSPGSGLFSVENSTWPGCEMPSVGFIARCKI